MAFLLALVALASNEFGEAFLNAHAAQPGVVTTASGLQYRVLQAGDGRQHPLPGTSCSCHYEGRTAQEHSKSPPGKKFDSSFDRGEPASFAPNQVIRGWTEALQLMVAGDKWELYIPSQLGYGEGGAGDDIGAGDVLVFTLHLLGVNGPGVPAKQPRPRRHGGRGGGKRSGRNEL